jgi:hypothetical protein
VKFCLFLLALLPAAALAESLSAEIARHQIDEEFAALDINRDGYVSAAEAAGFPDIVTRFDKADRNRDGRLSRAEYTRLKAMKPLAKAKSSGKSAVGGTAPRRQEKKAAD